MGNGKRVLQGALALFFNWLWNHASCFSPKFDSFEVMSQAWEGEGSDKTYLTTRRLRLRNGRQGSFFQELLFVRTPLFLLSEIQARSRQLQRPRRRPRQRLAIPGSAAGP